jgi:hypothetical protein
VHGRDEVVVIAAKEFRRLKGSATGQALIEAMQAYPHRDIQIALMSSARFCEVTTISRSSFLPLPTAASLDAASRAALVSFVFAPSHDRFARSRWRNR